MGNESSTLESPTPESPSPGLLQPPQPLPSPPSSISPTPGLLKPPQPLPPPPPSTISPTPTPPPLPTPSPTPSPSPTKKEDTKVVVNNNANDKRYISTTQIATAVRVKWHQLWCDERYWPKWLYEQMSLERYREHQIEQDKFLKKNQEHLRQILKFIYGDTSDEVEKMMTKLKLDYEENRKKKFDNFEAKLESSPSTLPSSSPLSSPLLSPLPQLKKYEKMAKLPNFIQTTVLPFDTLAAFVLVDHLSSKTPPRVLSIGTGTKCIERRYFTTRPQQQAPIYGDRVAHLHAEVIARRGLLRVLHEQIRLFHNNEKNGISAAAQKDDPEMKVFLERSPKNLKKLRLKPNLSLHLFVTKCPCGAAASSASKSNKLCVIDDSGTIVETVNDIVDYRNKLKGFHTCSDKILRWNVLGIQGALLSEYLEPIHVASVRIIAIQPPPPSPSSSLSKEGSNDEMMMKPLNTKQCYDAFYDRYYKRYKHKEMNEVIRTFSFKSYEDFLKWFNDGIGIGGGGGGGGCESLKNKPSDETTTPTTTLISHNWYEGCTKIELINQHNGLVVERNPLLSSAPIDGIVVVMKNADQPNAIKTKLYPVSRLSKEAFLRLFVQLSNNREQISNMTAHQMKRLPKYHFPGIDTYRSEKNSFKRSILDSNLGHWISSSASIDTLVCVKNSFMFIDWNDWYWNNSDGGYLAVMSEKQQKQQDNDGHTGGDSPPPPPPPSIKPTTNCVYPIHLKVSPKQMYTPGTPVKIITEEVSPM